MRNLLRLSWEILAFMIVGFALVMVILRIKRKWFEPLLEWASGQLDRV